LIQCVFIEVLSKRSRFAKNVISKESKFAVELTKKGRDIIKLNTGDPAKFFKTPKYIIDAYVSALRKNMTGYSKGDGTLELKKAVSKRYKRMYKMDVDDKSIIITNGVSEALFYLNSEIINNGDKAVLFKPYYPQYLAYLMMHDGKAVSERYNIKNNYGLNIDSLNRKLKKLPKRKLPKYMLINTPNNPTGTVLNKCTLKEVVDVANEYESILISDEIYDEILLGNTKFISIGEVAKGVPHIILNGASKNFDATGFRLGFVVIPEHDKISVQIKDRLYDYVLTRLSANTPAQHAITEALNNVSQHKKELSVMLKEIEARINLSFKILSENEYIDITKPDAAFYLFPKLHINELKFRNDTEFMMKLLEKEGIWIREGCGFGMKNYFRVVSLADKNILNDSLNRMNAFCKQNAKRGS